MVFASTCGMVSGEAPDSGTPRDSDFDLQGVTDLRLIGTVKSTGTLGAQFSRSASSNSLGKVICSK